MALTKMVDGKCVECSVKEEMEIRAEWDKNDKVQKEKLDYDYETEKLAAKYPCVYRAIDAIYQKLGM